MKRTTLLAAAASCAALSLGFVYAQPQQGGGQQQGQMPPGGPPGPPPQGPPAYLTVLDSNKDGTVSAEELDRASESLLTLDTNSDGALSFDETHILGQNNMGGQQQGQGGPPQGNSMGQGGPPQGGPPQGQGGMNNSGMPPHGGPPLFIMALDPDHDRQLSAEEISAAAANLGALDTNGDGHVDSDELFGPDFQGPRI